MKAFVGISREKAYPWHSNAAAFHPHSTPAVRPRDIKGGPLSRFTLYKPTKATRLKIEKKSQGLATEKSRVSYLKHPTREIPIASEDLDVGVEEKEAWRAKAKVVEGHFLSLCLFVDERYAFGLCHLISVPVCKDSGVRKPRVIALMAGRSVLEFMVSRSRGDRPMSALVASGNGEKADAIVHNSTLLIDNPGRITRFNPSRVEKKSFLLAYNYHPRGRERICQSGFLIYFGVTTPEPRWKPRQNERSMRRDPPIDQPKSFDLVDLTSSTLLHGLSSCEAFSSLP
ncbi:hypothetical protein V1478_018372 [Vespula squamosa]|uniref:Uncharacterized protein n=1 Tax=Vespula squamosa TaxID=30214 RepID=A0ABD1ZVD6_VESSQ